VFYSKPDLLTAFRQDADRIRSKLAATNDSQRRQAALDQVNRLSAIRRGVLDSGDLAAGFQSEGQQFPLINPQHGIFKPRLYGLAPERQDRLPEKGRSGLV
jgi:hypothetical protein